MPDTAKDGEKLELDQSATPADAAAADPAQDDTQTATSSGEGEHTDPEPKEPTSMAEAIEQALEAAPDGEAPESKSDDKDDDGEADDPDATDDKAGDGEGGEAPEAEGTEEPDGDELPDDPTEDELKGAGPRAQKRIAKLLSQRKEARIEADQLRPDADNYRAVRTFMTENHLDDGEVAQLFQAGADLKSGDPKRMQAFLDRVAPLVQQALEATGRAVPQDLQAQVDNGEMTAEAAQQVGQSRHATSVAQAQAERATTQVQQRDATDAQNAIATAVGQWAERTKITDPDFDRKKDVMTRVSQALVAEKGLPKTPQEATEMAKAAYEEATRILRAANPPKPTRQQPAPSTSTHRNAVKTAPTSLEDIVSQGLGLT